MYDYFRFYVFVEAQDRSLDGDGNGGDGRERGEGSRPGPHIQPSEADLWTAGELIDLIQKQRAIGEGPGAAFVVSRAITGTNLAADASSALGRLELSVLDARTHQRVAYPQALAQGVSVIDLDETSKAAQEIKALAEETITILESQSPFAHD